MIAFDGDDTLWLCDPSQKRWERECKRLHIEELIGPNATQPFRRGLREFGYTPQGIMCALFAAGRESRKNSEWMRRAEAIPALMDELHLKFPSALESTLDCLRQADLTLWIVTKGDLLRQAMMLAALPYVAAFHVVDIVDRKNATTYASLLATNDCSPAELTMVGDRFFEDITPVLRLGARAVHVPAGYERAIGAVERLIPAPESEFAKP